jgi:hypothetical protein
MKIFYFAILILSFSCSKSIEKNCFVDKINDTDDVVVFEIKKSYTVRQILAEKPDYLDMINLKKYREFKKDSADSHSYIQDFEEDIAKNEDGLKILNEKFFDQFDFFAKQQIGNTLYGLGKNQLDFWLLKIENNIPKAYFLGLSPNHYYFNQTQENPIIQGDYLQVEGSLVKTVEAGGRPGYSDYSVIEDGKLFKIKLKDLMVDTDNDGYNDIFEKCFGLNPDNKDSDGDGINDFEDMNPMFKSEKNKFTQLYELLLPYYGNANLKNSHYTFQVYKNNCDYFHQINPEIRVLFIPEEKNNQTYYTRVTDLMDEEISKIQKDKNNPNSFYIYKVGNSFKNDYTADYEKGKWILKVVGGYII